MLQWGGAAVLGIGIWLAADQSSFLTLIKFTQAENVQVPKYTFFLLRHGQMRICVFIFLCRTEFGTTSSYHPKCLFADCCWSLYLHRQFPGLLRRCQRISGSSRTGKNLIDEL